MKNVIKLLMVLILVMIVLGCNKKTSITEANKTPPITLDIPKISNYIKKEEDTITNTTIEKPAPLPIEDKDLPPILKPIETNDNDAKYITIEDLKYIIDETQKGNTHDYATMYYGLRYDFTYKKDDPNQINLENIQKYITRGSGYSYQVKDFSITEEINENNYFYKLFGTVINNILIIFAYKPLEKDYNSQSSGLLIDVKVENYETKIIFGITDCPVARYKNRLTDLDVIIDLNKKYNRDFVIDGENLIVYGESDKLDNSITPLMYSYGSELNYDSIIGGKENHIRGIYTDVVKAYRLNLETLKIETINKEDIQIFSWKIGEGEDSYDDIMCR